LDDHSLNILDSARGHLHEDELMESTRSPSSTLGAWVVGARDSRRRPAVAGVESRAWVWAREQERGGGAIFSTSETSWLSPASLATRKTRNIFHCLKCVAPRQPASPIMEALNQRGCDQERNKVNSTAVNHLVSENWTISPHLTT
jgi:hypothetical protein